MSDEAKSDSPAKDSAMAAPASRPPRFIVSRIAVILIALMWVVAGVTKVYSIDAFMDLINVHGVLAPEWHGLGIALPFIELILALVLVFVAGSELRKPFGRGVLLLSRAGIIGFAYYLSLVPDAVLQESGCGCLGPRVAAGMDSSVRVVAGVRTGALVALHLVALVGPVVTMRRVRRRSA